MDAKKLEEIIASYKTEKGALIPILHDIQRQEGYVPEDSLEYLSRSLRIPLSEVFRTVTYYERTFSLKPRAPHTIKICQGTSCYLKHGEQTLAEIKDEVEREGEKKAELFSIEKVRCLGCCNISPAVEIDGTILDKETAKKSIITLKGEK